MFTISLRTLLELFENLNLLLLTDSIVSVISCDDARLGSRCFYVQNFE